MRRALVVLAFAALFAPGTAQAHLRTGRVAVDYRAAVNPLHPPLAGAVNVRIFRSDLAIRLRAIGGHRVIVLGYFGEPFIRLGPDGAWVNGASLTASGTGLAKAGAPGWRLRSRDPSVTWHDARIRAVRNGPWAIPLEVDGMRVQLGGLVNRVGAPSAWPWIGVGVLVAAAAALLVRRARQAAAWLGGVAATATLVAAIGFAAASTANEGIWVEAGNEILLVLVGAAVLLRGSPNTKAIAGGLLGLLALAFGLTKLSVLTHGIVLSALPGQLARLAVAVAISAGAAAAILGAVVLVRLLRDYEEPQALQRYL